jgi:hypothetical protein
MTSRIQVTPSSKRQGDILETWAKFEGRSSSGLAAFLLEFALVRAAQEGIMPQSIAREFGFNE